MKYWKISPLLPFGCAKEEDSISIDEWNNLVDYVLDNAEVVVKIKKLFEFSILDKFIENGRIKDIAIVSNCGDVKSKLYVYPDLTVYPCTCYKVNDDSSCASCKYLKYCNGGCIGMSYNHFGELGRGDYRCPMVK